jgi:hypothetical protein
MRFQDPCDCLCKSCGTENKIRVRVLLDLTANCPNCAASLREYGLGIRSFIDEISPFWIAGSILFRLEDQLAITISDEALLAGRDYDQLTLECAC